MNRKLLEILACPIDKHHPLELFENKLDGEKIAEELEVLGIIPILLDDEIQMILPYHITIE